MSRSMAMTTWGTHKKCGGRVRFIYTMDKYTCEKCGQLVEEKNIEKDKK